MMLEKALAVAAFVGTIVSAIRPDKLPLWVPMLLISLIVLLGYLTQ